MRVWFQATQGPALQWIRFHSMMKYLPDNFEAPEFAQDVEDVFWEAMMDEGDPSVLHHFEELINKGFDTVILQRLFRPAGLAMMSFLQQNGVKVITEIDDGLELHVAHPAYAQWEARKGYEVTKEQLRMSDGVYVTTDYLKNTFSQYNENIAVIANSMDKQFMKHHYVNSEMKRIKNRSNSGKIKIIYIGSSSHNADIESVYKQLNRFAKEYKDFVEVILLGGCNSFANRKDHIIKRPTRHHIFDYYKFLADESPHIGIAPLVVNEFNKCKSNLRFLEYSSVGAVTLASNIEDFKKPIQDGMCLGYDGYKKNDFYNSLKKLIECGKLNIEKMGKKAKTYAEETYNTKAEAQKLYNFINGLR